MVSQVSCPQPINCLASERAKARAHAGMGMWAPFSGGISSTPQGCKLQHVCGSEARCTCDDVPQADRPPLHTCDRVFVHQLHPGPYERVHLQQHQQQRVGRWACGAPPGVYARHLPASNDTGHTAWHTPSSTYPIHSLRAQHPSPPSPLRSTRHSGLHAQQSSAPAPAPTWPPRSRLSFSSSEEYMGLARST